MATENTEELFQRRMRELILELRDAEQLSYKALAGRLERQGFAIDAKVLANRVQRGRFSAGFALAVLQALGCTGVTLAPPASKRLRVIR